MNQFKWNLLAVALTFLIGCTDIEPENTSKMQAERRLVTSGELVSTNSISVSPPAVSRMWQYKIQYMVSENSKVNKGDVVVRFDPQKIVDDLMSKQSELAAAIKENERAQLDSEQKLQGLKLDIAEAKMRYSKEKRKAEIVDGARSGIEKEKQQKSFEIAALKFEQSKQKLANYYAAKEVNDTVSKSNINRLRTEVEQLESDKERLNVKAGKSGIVMYVADHKGEKLAVGDSVWQGQRVLTIPSLDVIEIKAQFDEPDTEKVQLQSKVKVTLDAYPEIPFIGEITSLGLAYRAKSQQNPKVVFDAFIALSKIDSSLMRPGMKAKVEVLELATAGDPQ